MQRAYRSVRVPGAPAAVAREDFGQRVGVLGQMLQRNRAVLDEAHRFSVATQAHHDVQSGFADLPQVFLRSVVDHFDDAAGQTQIAHELDQLREAGQQLGLGGS